MAGPASCHHPHTGGPTWAELGHRALSVLGWRNQFDKEQRQEPPVPPIPVALSPLSFIGIKRELRTSVRPAPRLPPGV